MVKSLIDRDLIQITNHPFSRDSAIIFAAQPLLSHNKISSAYITKMLEAIEKYGTYIVIAKGIALAHAQACDDVIENCIGLTIFQQPIVFGHKRNDPVKYLFVLASKESNTHLEAFQFIAKKFISRKFTQRLDQFTCEEEVFQYFIS